MKGWGPYVLENKRTADFIPDGTDWFVCYNANRQRDDGEPLFNIDVAKAGPRSPRIPLLAVGRTTHSLPAAAS